MAGSLRAESGLNGMRMPRILCTLLLAVALLLPAQARADASLATTFSGAAGVEAVRRSTTRGTLNDTYPALQAHAELGATFIAGGALVGVGDLSFPVADRPFGTQLTAGAGVRFGPDLRVTLGGGATFWQVSGAGQSGPSLFAHLALPLSGGFGLHLQGMAGFFTGVASVSFTLGVGYSD
jgi:hypothetical protein